MTAKEIVEELRTLGAESSKKVLRNHGVQEPFFGVKIGDMKKIQKRIKHSLSVPGAEGPWLLTVRSSRGGGSARATAISPKG
jgi:hypothetical protein